MKTFLLFKDRDFHPDARWSANDSALHKDLDLGRLIAAMAAGDGYIADVAGSVLRAPMMSLEDIDYRQHVLIDAMENSDFVRELYALARETIEGEQKIYRSIFSRSPSALRNQSIQSLEMLVGVLGRLKTMCSETQDGFHSQGFTRFLGMVLAELDENYLAEINEHLRHLRFKNGTLLAAGLGRANKGHDYTLSNPGPDTRNWLARMSGKRPQSFSFHINDRDEEGFRALGELADQGIGLAADVLAQSDDHIMNFIKMMRQELAFFVGCINLEAAFLDADAPLCFPKAETSPAMAFSAVDLRDVSLTVARKGPVVGNNINADGKSLIMITGANEGGKSTFLRSMGTAQLMMQCGMFVCARYFSAGIAAGLFSHYKREEFLGLKSGKLDEELERMSGIVDVVKPHAMVLFNESFSSANEREGTVIARDIIQGLIDSGMRVVFVTHFYELAESVHALHAAGSLLLRAGRTDSGGCTFTVVEGAPERTSYGKDLYAKVFMDSGSVLMKEADHDSGQ
ncbi:MutS-related protein [Arthrobacter psychrochitiniphilus]|uniref:MutS-related protein n=1 Tax=Arthrobacter psychrochitiniphilus TaxID=291045 RepID=UPI003F7C7275